MPVWLVDMIGVFLGAVLGALFGYAASHRQGRQESLARRHALFRVLSDQLHMLPPHVPEFEPTRLLVWGAIHVSAADQLLSGYVLDARSDAQLIRRLIILQALEASYNEGVRVYNQAAVTQNIAPNHHRAWHQRLTFDVEQLRRCRHDVLTQVPDAYRSPSWPELPPDAPPDAGLLFEYRVDDEPQAPEPK